MSEPIRESIPTSSDFRSKRPSKRLALTSTTQQASQLNALFAKADRPITLPPSGADATRSTLPPPPEIVANVQGSSAGAGSGEFHVYKASRRREYERVQAMEEEVREERADEEFERRKEERRRKEEGKVSRSRKRRERKKSRLGMGGPVGSLVGNGVEDRDLDMADAGDGGGNDGGTDGVSGRVAVVEEVGVVIYDDE